MPLTNCVITKATVADLASLRAISEDTFVETFAEVNTAKNMRDYVAEHFNAETVRIQLENPHSLFYLARIDDRVAAYMKLNLAGAQTELQDDMSIEIQRIYVLKKFHGKAIGHALFETALQLAKQEHKKYLWLAVWEHNPQAIRFYERQGFKAFDQHIFKLGNEEQLDIMMKLELVNL